MQEHHRYRDVIQVGVCVHVCVPRVHLEVSENMCVHKINQSGGR